MLDNYHERTQIQKKSVISRDFGSADFESLERESFCRMPTKFGVFTMHCFVESKNKVHHALVMGELRDDQRHLVRIHSKCCTGDVFYSTRCDCGFQLKESMQQIGKAKKGIIIYLDQEGRGIGIVNKLKAYTLQDQGYNTYEANRFLGFNDDCRKYTAAIQILDFFNIKKINLLTNNPEKRSCFADYSDLDVTRSEIIQEKLTPDQRKYLSSKIKYKNHAINLQNNIKKDPVICEVLNKISSFKESKRPFVTLSFAQTIDGSIAFRDYKRALISNDKSMEFTHGLRSVHEAILVGVSTVIHDNPSLSARGDLSYNQPTPIILDSHLNTPLDSKVLLRNVVIIFITAKNISSDKQEEILKVNPKALFISVEYNKSNKLCLVSALKKLRDRGILSLMVEGGASIIKSFIIHRQIDFCAITISARYLGGLDYRDERGAFVLNNSKSYNYDGDVIITGYPK